MSFRVSNSYLLGNRQLNFSLPVSRQKSIVRINNWYGRLGNNIIQIINALHVAMCLNTNLYFLSHYAFKSNQVIVNKDVTFTNNLYIDMSNFYYQNTQPSEFFTKNFIEVRNRLKELFFINTDEIEYEKDDNLVIHIRGGDIIDKHGYPDYILPPMSYYENIIDSKEWNKITIISEDRNWIVEYLLEKYPVLQFQIQSLKEDILTILKSKNIVSSVGTFIPALIILANNQKNVYKIANLNFQNLDHYHPHNYIYYNLDEYLKMVGKWTNSKGQIELVKSYKLKNCS